MSQFNTAGWNQIPNASMFTGADIQAMPLPQIQTPSLAQASGGNNSFLQGLRNMFVNPTMVPEGGNMYAAGQAQAQNAFNPLAQPINPNAMPGGAGGIQQPNNSFGSWFSDGYDASQVNAPVVGDPMNMSINPNAMPQPVSSLNMFQGQGTAPATAGATSPVNQTSTITPFMGTPSQAHANQNTVFGTNPNQSFIGQGDTTALTTDTGMFDNMSGQDWLNTGFGALQAGLGAYGMFSQLGQADRGLDIAQGNLDLKQDSFDETLRHRQALVNQNKSA